MVNPSIDEEFKDNFSDKSFWGKIANFAKVAGIVVIEKSLTLYFCFLDADTPYQAKMVIIGALGYFISPLDAIPDIVPGAGYTDDLAVLSFAVVAVAAHVKPIHKEKTKDVLKTWFK